MIRTALYLHVSQDSQTVENQLLVLTEGGATVRLDRGGGPFRRGDQRRRRACAQARLRGAAEGGGAPRGGEVAAWSVDRLGRSLPDLVAFLGEVRASGRDLYLRQQAMDTSTPAGRMMFQLLGVFAEFERAIITSWIVAGQAWARAKGVRFARPPVAPMRLERGRAGLANGGSIRAAAQAVGVSTAAVMRVKRGGS